MRKKMPRVAPHNEGFPVSVNELRLPESTLNPHIQDNYNNHHFHFTARAFGRSVLYQTLRNLDANQLVIPKDVHAVYHALYTPPPMPSPLAAMDRVDEAYQKGEMLRYGSALNPRYDRVTEALWLLAQQEYEAAA